MHMYLEHAVVLTGVLTTGIPLLLFNFNGLAELAESIAVHPGFRVINSLSWRSSKIILSSKHKVPVLYAVYIVMYKFVGNFFKHFHRCACF